MSFEWDADKAQANVRKHGVSFDEAIRVFDDPFSQTFLDKRFAYDEDRFLTLGTVDGRLYVVVHTDRGSTVRIIMARSATAKERRAFANGPRAI